MAQHCNESQYCTTREAAALLGISVRTAQQWVEKGKLAAWKTEGGHRRITSESVQKAFATRQAKLQRRQQAKRLKVLIIEDDEVLLELYKLRIEDWGLPIDLFTAQNGVQGLFKIGQESPDLLITDLYIPEVDGLRITRRLFQSPQHKRMEIVVVTGLSQAEIEERGGLPGDVQCFTKPVPFDALQAICTRLLNRRRRPRISAAVR